MKIVFCVSETLYDCELAVTDINGTRFFRISAAESPFTEGNRLEVEIEGEAATLTVTPQAADYKTVLSELDTDTWKDKFAVKVTDRLMSALQSTLLRVGCKYRLTDLKDGDVLNIIGQEYIFGTFDRFDLLGLFPVIYMFYEVFRGDTRLELLDAFQANRREVLTAAKKLTLLDFGIHLIFTYPIQIGRVKYLSKDRKISAVLKKFNRMSNAERQKFLAKKEKFMS